MQNKKWPYIFTIVAIIMMALTPLRLILENLLYQSHTYDFGIYFKSLIEIASGNSFNPFIGFRGEYIFGDHSDFIQFFYAPLVRLMDYKPYSVYISDFLFVLFSILILNFYILKRSAFRWHLFILFLFIFSRGIHSAMGYPIHPLTWAILPLVIFILCAQNAKSSPGLISPMWMLATFFLCLFKEVFPIALFVYFFVLLIINKEQRKNALFGLTISSIFLLYFPFHHLLTDRSYHYLLKEQVSYFANIKRYPYIDFFKAIYPLIIPLWILTFKQFRYVFRDFSFWAFYISLNGMHWLSGKGYYHYNYLISVPIIIWIAVQDCKFEEYIQKLNRTKYFLIMLPIVLAGVGSYTKSIKATRNIILEFNEKYPVIQKRAEFLESYLDNIDPKSKIFATTSIITRHLKPGRDFYEINSYTINPPKYFDAIALSVNSNDLTYPYNREQIQNLINRCRSYSDKILINNEDYFLALGRFPKECFF